MTTVRKCAGSLALAMAFLAAPAVAAEGPRTHTLGSDVSGFVPGTSFRIEIVSLPGARPEESWVRIEWTDQDGWHYVTCSGTAYEEAALVHRGTGRTVVRVAVDPVGEGCFSYNVAAPLAFDLAGEADPGFSDSSTMIGSTRNGDAFSHYTRKIDCYRVRLTGQLPLPQWDSVTALACSSRRQESSF
jgi:hypothetical protein